jgi:DNA-directed RNA polymerase I subunit RPA2
MLLRDSKRYAAAVASRAAALTFLGARFRTVLDMPASLSDEQAGRHLLDRYILVHIHREALRDKFNLFIIMLRKL